MDIKINKDIATEYPTDVWKGFSIDQIFCILLAGTSGAAMICLLYFLLGFSLQISVYGAFPVAAPIIFAGFYRYRGIRGIDAVKHWLRIRRQSVLPYAAEEADAGCEPEGKQKEKSKSRHTKRKQKKEDAAEKNKQGGKDGTIYQGRFHGSKETI